MDSSTKEINSFKELVESVANHALKGLGWAKEDLMGMVIVPKDKHVHLYNREKGVHVFKDITNMKSAQSYLEEFNMPKSGFKHLWTKPWPQIIYHTVHTYTCEEADIVVSEGRRNYRDLIRYTYK